MCADNGLPLCSLVQALLYTLCFRLPQLMASDNAAKFETFLRLELRLQDIVLCPLNPLKVIDQAVGGKFVTLAVKYRLIQTQVKRRGAWREGESWNDASAADLQDGVQL